MISQLKITISLMLVVAACASSEIGGQVVFNDVDGKQSSQISGSCSGSCKKFDGGICVQFSDQISGVCQKHFLRVSQVRAVSLSNSTSGKCSPIVSNVSGDVNITFSGSCN